TSRSQPWACRVTTGWARARPHHWRSGPRPTFGHLHPSAMIARSLWTLAWVLLLAPPANAQKALTNRDIWASPLFSAEGVGGLASMKDGQHYTVLETEGEEAVINQYAYRTGAKTATVLRGAALVPTGGTEPVDIDGYA